ncbi:BSP-domain-containing protein [Clavulina sp. PMI_390]|nr:BSP-domain-containing protein [Clavulina sp. PMI_390]
MPLTAPLPRPQPKIDLPAISLRLHPVTGSSAIHFLQQFGSQAGEILPAHCRTIIADLYDPPTSLSSSSSYYSPPSSSSLASPSSPSSSLSSRVTPTPLPPNVPVTPATSTPSSIRRRSTGDTLPPPGFPTIHTITVFIREMDGVAYTSSSPSNPDAKEIHCSAAYFGQSNFREISGVLIHELVHVWQRDGQGSAPGGWIEGVADWVRLKAGLGAGHWRKSRPGKEQTWDAGYERTAYFLEWAEARTTAAKGFIRRVNARLAYERWGDWVWEEAGAPVDELWAGYVRSFDADGSAGAEEGGSGPAPAMPTHAVTPP